MEDALANYLKMPKRQQVIALLALGWSFRRIERETGVRRETVSRYSRPADPNPAKVFPGSEGSGGPQSGREAEENAVFATGTGSNPAKVFPGSGPKAAKAFAGSNTPPRSSAAHFHDAIVEKLDEGLSVQRVYQDLQDEYGYAYSYESVKRYVRKLERRQRRAAGVMHSLPGEESQVDFFQGAPTLDATTGRWRRPWVFRMTLCHSRHGYEEAVWDQKVATFLRLHENAFRDLAGVPRVVRHDNLKAAVVRACLYDPDVNAVYESFSKHWGFTALPTKPRNPRENGKQERSGGYVKDNALKRRRFNSLDEQNQYLRHWNRTVARLRIHGTTRRQVFTHYEQTDKKALQPLAAEPFAIFERGTRTVHPDGHVEVDGAFYPVPVHLLGVKVEVRWDARLIRVFHGETAVAVHARVRPGEFARRPGENSQEPTSSQRAYMAKLIGTCARVGPALQEWAEAAYVERGMRALRLVQGALHLVRKHPREAVLHAANKALAHRLFRYKDLRRLTEQADSVPQQRSLLDVHEAIRPMNEYRLEDLL
jgi:transposase